ncbi:hypothetical protein DXA50_14905 [Butyricimonas virosa]|jgi:hypothetical protein|uniref:Uncharacterized protein n=2 Tax=Butyricimonas virosa TaxID=544645 RepID=A0A413IKD7_9BACT|nr:hypothetical protein DXA50_14905 [Butyricimonas virosa]HAP18871.1 hypothetical protein [Butyricimonas virosa]
MACGIRRSREKTVDMNTNFFEDYERELLVVNVLMTKDATCTYVFNHHRDVAAYRTHLMILELKLMNELVEFFPCGVIGKEYRQMLVPHLLTIRNQFQQKKNGRITRPDLICRKNNGIWVIPSDALQKRVLPFLQVQWESLNRIRTFIGEDDRFPDYPYRFVGKTSEVTHFCVALCACRKLEGISGKINLPQLVKDTCRLLNIKVPDRPDLLVERVFNCKNRFLNLDRFCRKYKEEVQKGN